MRVVAGEYKGRRLVAPGGTGTRPTADRVREAVFSILGPLDGERVLDLFAGSGAMAIEALSRGAGEAVLVDRDRSAIAAIERNVRSVGARTARWERRSAFGFLTTYDGAPFDLVFVDPPYSSAAGLGPELAETMPRHLTHDARIVTESDKRDPLGLPFPLVRERTYGDTRIAVHRAS